MHENVIISWTAIVTPKLYACTLVSTMVVLIMGDALQGVHMKNTIVLSPLEFRPTNSVKFEKLVAYQRLNVEYETGTVLLISPKYDKTSQYYATYTKFTLIV